MTINKGILHTSTNIQIFRPGLIHGKITLTLEDIGHFTCGSFMRDIVPKRSLSESINNVNYVDTLIYIDDEFWKHDLKLVDWWLNKLKDIDIDSKYLGKEKDIHIIRYRVINSFSSSFRLLRFSLLRYLWACPYRTLVEHMFKIRDSLEIDRKGFWFSFMEYHAQLSNFYNYSSTFGLTEGNFKVELTDEKFINLCTTKQRGDLGINNMFSREGSNFGRSRLSDSAIKYKMNKLNEK